MSFTFISVLKFIDGGIVIWRKSWAALSIESELAEC